MTRELAYDEPLDEGYWESLGMEGDQARPGDPFNTPPPGAGQDPFSGQDTGSGRGSRYEPVWLTTRKGVQFIDVFVGDQPGSEDTHMLIFLYEVLPGRWNVGLSRPKTVEGGDFLYKDLSYEDAKQEAESEASAMSVDAGANAQWRFGSPSGGQLNFARVLGIKLDGTESKGEVSDKINTVTASRTLDPTFAPKRS